MDQESTLIIKLNYLSHFLLQVIQEQAWVCTFHVNYAITMEQIYDILTPQTVAVVLK
jgi:hypothetical protein